jgi:predicted MFS family arabinose efflux permease
VTAATDQVFYVVCLLTLNIGILFMVPYFMGVLAELDEEGSWATLSAPIVAFGLALGPILMGLLAEKGGYAVMGGVSGVIYLFILALMLSVLNSRSFKEILPRS